MAHFTKGRFLPYYHVFLNNVQQMVFGEFDRGVSPDTVFTHTHTLDPLSEHLNSVQLMTSGEYREGVFPGTVCWTLLRHTWCKGRDHRQPNVVHAKGVRPHASHVHAHTDTHTHTPS